MKYQPQLYARAFVQALEEGVPEATAVQKCIRMIFRMEGARAAWRVVDAVRRELVRSRGGRLVRVETARLLDERARNKLRSCWNDVDHVEEYTRPELAAGVRIVVNNEREFDGSLKRKLDKLFV